MSLSFNLPANNSKLYRGGALKKTLRPLLLLSSGLSTLLLLTLRDVTVSAHAATSTSSTSNVNNLTLSTPLLSESDRHVNVDESSPKSDGAADIPVPKAKLQPDTPQQDDDESIDFQCVICYVNPVPAQDLAISACCRQVYCRGCVHTWLQHGQSCPLCRHSPFVVLRAPRTCRQVMEDMMDTTLNFSRKVGRPACGDFVSIGLVCCGLMALGSSISGLSDDSEFMNRNEVNVILELPGRSTSTRIITGAHRDGCVQWARALVNGLTAAESPGYLSSPIEDAAYGDDFDTPADQVHWKHLEQDEKYYKSMYICPGKDVDSPGGEPVSPYKFMNDWTLYESCVPLLKQARIWEYQDVELSDTDPRVEKNPDSEEAMIRHLIKFYHFSREGAIQMLNRGNVLYECPALTKGGLRAALKDKGILIKEVLDLSKGSDCEEIISKGAQESNNYTSKEGCSPVEFDRTSGWTSESLVGSVLNYFDTKWTVATSLTWDGSKEGPYIIQFRPDTSSNSPSARLGHVKLSDETISGTSASSSVSTSSSPKSGNFLSKTQRV